MCGGAVLARLEGPGGGENQFRTDGVRPRYPLSVPHGMSEWFRGRIPAGRDPGRCRGRRACSRSGPGPGEGLNATWRPPAKLLRRSSWRFPGGLGSAERQHSVRVVAV